MLARCRHENRAGAAEWERNPRTYYFASMVKARGCGVLGWQGQTRHRKFSRLRRFFQLHQLIVDGFQQGRFAFLHAHANLFFAEQVGQNFKLGFIRRFRQQTGEDGAVLGDGLDVAVAQGGQASGISS